jgi:thioredoxin 1
MKFKHLFLALALILSACTSTGEPVPESTNVEAEYELAISEGKDVFVDFFAPWCSICVANQTSIEAAFEAVNNPDLVKITVDYDSDTFFKAKFDVFQQSTYILVPNGNEDEFKTLGPGFYREKQFTEFLDI